MERGIQLLLEQVSVIDKKYDDVAKITGENFNLFKLLRLETNEVRTHSTILGELLNPKGSHGLSQTFLTLFISQFGITDFDAGKAQLFIEPTISRISEDGTTGGRIDILITSGQGREIIIENKIYAADQKNQLLRYRNAYPNAYIFYLTLNGGKIFKESDLVSVDYEPISYAYDIIKWLELCKKEAVNYPILRETITQYINLIKLLTGQNINKTMTKEIYKILLSTISNFKSAEVVHNMYNEIITSIEKGFFEEINKQSNNQPSYILWNNFRLENVLLKDNGGVFFGVMAKTIDGQKIDNNLEVFRILKSSLHFTKPSTNYIEWLYHDKYKNFYDSEILFELSTDDSRKKCVQDLLEESEMYFKHFTIRLNPLTTSAQCNFPSCKINAVNLRWFKNSFRNFIIKNKVYELFFKLFIVLVDSSKRNRNDVFVLTFNKIV